MSEAIIALKVQYVINLSYLVSIHSDLLIRLKQINRKTCWSLQEKNKQTNKVRLQLQTLSQVYEKITFERSGNCTNSTIEDGCIWCKRNKI